MWKKKIVYQSEKPLLFYLIREQDEFFLKHNHDGMKNDPEIKECFLIPNENGKGDRACRITAARPFRVIIPESEACVEIQYDGTEEEINLIYYSDVPNCDICGNMMHLDFKHGQEMQEAAYQFYWRTLLPSVVEKTTVSGYEGCNGYVVSTLEWNKYAGTYPDVDHEFQIKGRLAMGSSFELALVRRMMELQLKLMEEDPQDLYRDPCAMQPDGTREYHVRRNSMDRSHNAVMFLVTGNIEIIEAASQYLASTGDWEWWKQHKVGLEKSLLLVEECMDHQGRLWSDVYYEDQVIKDGRECMSAALAADAMRRMAQMEELSGDLERRDYYLGLEKKLADVMIKPLPTGFWDEDKQRFADWVDRNGVCHDHIHLLANELPVLFGYADDRQKEGVEKVLEEYQEEFQRFPTFVAGRIQDYTDDEIGDGGPYDLCAAGRYWCWDFAYWCFTGRKDMLERQLLAVCEQARSDDYLMGERYDMNYIYYQSDINWHGASHYYEYPCVFLWNLIHGYLGIQWDIEADLRIAPMLTTDGTVRMEGDSYGVSYEIKGKDLTVCNLMNRQRRFRLSMDGEELIIILPGGGSFTWQRSIK